MFLQKTEINQISEDSKQLTHTSFSQFTMEYDYHLDISQQGRDLASSMQQPALPIENQVSSPLSEYDYTDSPEFRKVMTLLKSLSTEADNALMSIIGENEQNISSFDFEEFLGKLNSALSSIEKSFSKNAGANMGNTNNVQTESSIEISAEINIRFEFYAEDSQLRAEIDGNTADPIVLDLDGDGFELSHMKNGVEFDINADGVMDKTGFVKPDDGLLVLDRNGNGKIDNGKELFGDQHGAKDGFAELSKFDGDGNGVIDSNDAIYFKLQVWQDLNQDGNSSRNELNSLKDMGIDSIDLKNRKVINSHINGNILTDFSTYSRNGVRGNVGDAIFKYSKLA